MNDKQTIHRDIEDLRQLRDELRVQAHLARAEAKDLWVRLENTWPKVEQRFSELSQESGEAREHVTTAVRALLDELKSGYRELKKH